jgi:anti-sigma regulatory factor (Ser/Thr protein kinase)
MKPSATGTDTIELRIAARAENVALARLTLSGVAAAAGAPPDVVADLKLAVSEACTNAVQHAYAGKSADHEGQVILRFVVADHQLVVEVEDDGMGLTIVRSVTDEVQIESGGKGSRIAFSKKF